jgi:hypothetical protein
VSAAPTAPSRLLRLGTLPVVTAVFTLITAACAGSARRQGTDQILATRQVQLTAQMPIRLAPQRRAGR